MSSAAAPSCVEVESSDEDVVVEGSIDTDTGEVRRKEGSIDSGEGKKEGGKTRRGRRGGGGQKVVAGRQEKQVDTTQDSCTSTQSTGSRCVDELSLAFIA